MVTLEKLTEGIDGDQEIYEIYFVPTLQWYGFHGMDFVTKNAAVMKILDF